MSQAEPASAAPPTSDPKRLPWQGRLAAASHPNLVFWVSFVLLNGLLFAPFYLLSQQSSSFLPLSAPAGQSLEALLRQLFLWRNNLDVFRLSLEVALLAALWANVRWLWHGRRPRVFRLLFALVYILALGYAIYESVFLNLYQIDPVFYAQYRMLVDGIQFVVEHLGWPWTVYAGGAILLLALFAVILLLTRALIGGAPVERLSPWSRRAAAALALVAVIVPVAFGTPLASPRAAVNSLFAKLEQNVAESLALRNRIAAFDSSLPQQVYDYSRYALQQKPDIYLIFVESYGSVLYKRPDWRETYEALLAELEPELAGSGWYVSTALSESPTWGGGSWMAYTSALFGLRIDNHAEYLALLEQYQDARYPDLGRYLQEQGYYALYVSSISKELREENLEQYLNFYGVDDWLTYSRLGYEGPRYGWGPAPPDQYVLWHVEEDVVASLNQPLFLFTITQNSHYPWVPQPALVDDWRTLNQPGPDPAAPLPDQMPHQAKRRNYMSAVEYQLRFLTDFVLKNGRDNAVYVLIGDHQPQQVSRYEDGFETPVHIISRDSGFVQFFREYGFVDGLKVDKIAPTMRHEGFYSLFVRALLDRYGQGGRVLPPYLFNGIVTDQPEEGDESTLRR